MDILLVDDDEVDRLAVRRALRAARIDARVDEAASPGEALAALAARSYDCVLLDYHLPGMDGFQVMRRMQENGVQTAVVVLTGHGDEQTAVELMKGGAADYLSKSTLSPERLLQSLRYATERERLQRERDDFLRREQEARRLAEEANLAKDQFLAVVSHDLRTPLNAILGWARVLLTEHSDSTIRQRGLEVIERNARAQVQLIDDLLDVSRIISGKLHLDIRSVEPIRICQDAFDSVQLAAETRGVTLEVDLHRSVGPIIGDPGRLQQMVWNLLTNAIKFTPAGGTVVLRLRRLEAGAELTVADTGRGIPSEFLPRVFDRFTQAENRARMGEGGLGLGLAIVRSIVEMHGGTIRAESPGEGQGASFVVFLPWSPTAKAEVSEDSSAPMAPLPELTRTLEGLRVMFVDDSSDARELVTLILTRQGATVWACGSIDQALAKLANERPDVVISDIEMPDGDGYALIRALRVREDPAQRIPTIALTGHTRAEDRIRILSEGFHIHVPKPVDPTELVMVIATLAGRQA